MIRHASAAAAALLVAPAGTAASLAQHDDRAPGLVSVPDGASVAYGPGPASLPRGAEPSLVAGDSD